METKQENQEYGKQIRDLEDRLCDLAAEWRGMPEDRQRIKEEYHSTMKMLLSLGWDDVLDLDCELPNKEMPLEYTSRHPMTPIAKWGSVTWPKNKTQKW